MQFFTSLSPPSLPPSLLLNVRNKPTRSRSSILTFPQRASHSSHNTAVPSFPFTLYLHFLHLPVLSLPFGELSRSPLPFASLIGPLQSTTHTGKQRAPSALGRGVERGHRSQGLGCWRGRKGLGSGGWGNSFYYGLKRQICSLGLLRK